MPDAAPDEAGNLLAVADYKDFAPDRAAWRPFRPSPEFCHELKKSYAWHRD